MLDLALTWGEIKEYVERKGRWQVTRTAQTICIALVVAFSGSAIALAPDQQKKRAANVKAELSRYEHRVLAYDASSLPPREKDFLRKMLVAATLVGEINMLQIDPRDLEYMADVQKSGSEDDKMLFHRNQGPWCLESEDPLCNALASLPPKKIGWAFWPDGMNESLLSEMERQLNGNDLMSPFTYVVKEGDRYVAVPFIRSSVISGRMKRLAEVLLEAEKLTDEPTLKRFLRSRARAFETASAFPYDASDYDWIALKGPWEVTVGPYETYKEPMRKKAQFEMYIAREDPKVSAQLALYKKNLQEFEEHFADLIGNDVYKAKKLDPRIQIRAVELIKAAGDGRSPHGATVAYHLPNRGRSVEEGLYKKVMLLNHMRLFTPLMQKRAALALATDQTGLVDEWADIMNTTFHEFAHGFGAREELAITVNGERTTVSKALGSSETLMEELKADVASLWFIPYLTEKGLMQKSEINKRYATAVMHLFGLLQYSLNGTYPQMAAVEVGNLMEKGALIFDEKSGRFTIDFEKMPDAVNDLMKKIVTIQITGDRPGAVALRERYVKKTGENKFEFQPLIKEPLARLKAAFDKASLKSFAIDYEVKGL